MKITFPLPGLLPIFCHLSFFSPFNFSKGFPPFVSISLMLWFFTLWHLASTHPLYRLCSCKWHLCSLNDKSLFYPHVHYFSDMTCRLSLPFPSFPFPSLPFTSFPRSFPFLSLPSFFSLPPLQRASAKHHSQAIFLCHPWLSGAWGYSFYSFLCVLALLH